MKGRLIAIVGPSGAGKDTLMAGLAAAHPDVSLVRRAITRPADSGGEDHEALDRRAFMARLAAGRFLVHWRAHGLDYGIPCESLARARAGGIVLFNGSRAALPAARAACPGLEVVMITAPAPVLAERLAARGREAQADIAARLVRGSALQVPPGARVVMNDADVAAGVARLAAALGLSPPAAGG